MSLDKATLDRIVEFGSLAANFTRADDEGDPFLVLPNGTHVESLAAFCPPTRIKRSVMMLEADSFSDYVNRFKTDQTLIFAAVGIKGVTFAALLDYHHSAPNLTPGYCEHRVTYVTIETPEWNTWMAANRQPMDQVAFATWLEDNAPLFREPTGAALLELVQTLEGKAEVRFNSAVRLTSGTNRLAYDEDVTLKGATSTTNGAIDLPKTILAGIAPFQGAPINDVSARLKFRINGRKLSLWFETIAVHAIMRDSILLVVKQIAEKTKIIPLIGNP